MTVTSKR